MCFINALIILSKESCCNISEFTQKDGMMKRTAKRLCVTNVTGLLLMCDARHTRFSIFFPLPPYCVSSLLWLLLSLWSNLKVKFFLLHSYLFPEGYVCGKKRPNKGCDQRLLINNSPCNTSEYGLLGWSNARQCIVGHSTHCIFEIFHKTQLIKLE